MRLARTIPVLLAIGLLSAGGCSKDHDLGPTRNPRDPATGGERPPVPTEVRAEIEDRAVTLSWALPDDWEPAEIRSYRIYRRSGIAEEFSLADSAVASPKRISGLLNGTGTLFSVSAVLKNGLEGDRSSEVAAAPGLFAISIAEGREVTASRAVLISAEAPNGTTAILLSNDPALADAVTLSFGETVSWILLEGDGVRTAYARFADGAGNLSSIVSDAIRVDTRAEILSLEYDGPDTREPGEQIEMRLSSGEPAGFAQVEIPRGGQRWTMRDDGVAPDAQPGDGVYSLLYPAETAVQFIGAEIVGHFQDEAGNQAPARAADRRLTIHSVPPAVTLEEPGSPDPESISLRWSRAPEGIPFGSYRLLRAEAPGVDTASDRVLVREFTSRSQTEHTDSDLEPGRQYYYSVQLLDPDGFGSYSNEVSRAPQANDSPIAVVLASPYGITEESVRLDWSRNHDSDFALYRVVRGERAGVDTDPDRRNLSEIRNAATTTYEDRSELEEGKTYYYRIEVVDLLGAGAWSNEVSATIEDLYPDASTLSAPDPAGETTIGLSWSRNSDLDFAEYRLHRSENAGVGEGSTLVTTITDAERTRWTDSGLRENTDYYYRLFVRDRGGQSSPSNEILVTTDNADPPAVTLNAPVEVAGAQTPTLDLSWTASSVHDFENYRIYRDTSPAVGENSTLVRVIDLISTLTYRDADLTDNTRYYYRVFVRDDAGGSTGSSERSIVTANRAPTPVTLSLGGTTTASISLSWTRNADADFASYRLMRGTSPGAITQTVASFDRREQTSYTDFLPGGDPEQDYFYKVVVADADIDGGSPLTSDSNIVSARLQSP